MNLVALLLGLALERLLTNLLHLRELRWFDRYFDWTLQSLNRFSGLAAAVLAAVYSIVPVLPVLGVGLAFGERLYGIPYVLFAALVLIFSIGPRDLGEEVEEYCQAVTDECIANPQGVEYMECSELTEADIAFPACAAEITVGECCEPAGGGTVLPAPAGGGERVRTFS